MEPLGFRSRLGHTPGVSTPILNRAPRDAIESLGGRSHLGSIPEGVGPIWDRICGVRSHVGSNPEGFDPRWDPLPRGSVPYGFDPLGIRSHAPIWERVPRVGIPELDRNPRGWIPCGTDSFGTRSPRELNPKAICEPSSPEVRNPHDDAAPLVQRISTNMRRTLPHAFAFRTNMENSLPRSNRFSARWWSQGAGARRVGRRDGRTKGRN